MNMRLLSVVLVLVMCLYTGCHSVQVRVGDRSFPLKAVKQLKSLLDLDSDGHTPNPRLAGTSVRVVCDDPVLPQVFRPVCQGRGAAMTFSRLASIISASHTCEICANPSCWGCTE
ncbi:guanylin-like [Genypterus blacodes]|uniref:guanylin-like n=1 Tax=Genypterus blacodes TaxID=154954 RepID=UPI003F7669D6